MPSPSDPLPPDPEDLELEPEAPPRRAGLPDAPSEREKLMGDLSKPRRALPSFPTQDQRQAKRLQDIALEGETGEPALREKARPETETRAAEGEGAAEEGVPQEVSVPVPRKTAPAGEAPESSGKQKEEEIRPGSGRSQPARATDFEPLSWASSETRVDLPEGEGARPARLGLGSCLAVAGQRLKAAWGRLSVIEGISVAAFLVAVLVGLFFFLRLGGSNVAPADEAGQKLSKISFPIEGKHLEVTDIGARWEEPQPGEIVRHDVLLVPKLRVQLGGGNGFFRVLFRDEVGKIRGDALALMVENGAIKMEDGVIRVEDGANEGDAEFVVVATDGYKNKMKLVECQAGRLEPWIVEVFESEQYDVPIEQWNLLARFGMPSES